jgi:hypothetical protein
VLAGFALYFLRLDSVAGLIGDDAWYVVLAKGIAQGSGPSVISSAGTQFLSQVYLPGIPAILPLVMLVSPEYPGNMALLKTVSISPMGAGLHRYVYETAARRLRPRNGAAVDSGIVFLATSTLMSEAVSPVCRTGGRHNERTARAEDDRAGRRTAAGRLAVEQHSDPTYGLT